MDITVNHNNKVTLNRLAIQSTAKEMIKQIASGELKEGEFPVKHRFAPGCYIREIFMPKGSRIIGKIHATEHFNIILSGKVTVITAEGSEYIEAPHTFVSKAGVQKVVFMHEDCVWQTVHITDETNIDEIEKEVIVEKYEDLKIDGLLSQGQGVLR